MDSSPQPAPVTWEREGFRISTDHAAIDVDAVHAYLSQRSYWSRGIPRDVVAASIAGSLPFGLFAGDRQIGFARVITDYATFAYLADVYVDEAHQGAGLGKWLIATLMTHPALQGLRRWLLITRDAHGLYARHGFVPLGAPDLHMERHDPDVYARSRRNDP